MSIIDLQNITHLYEAKEILSNFSLSFEAKEISCLLGSSGCGKTTILRLIAGLEIPQKGNIIIDNKEVTKDSILIKAANEREVGFVFQDLALWPHFTVFKNIAFGLIENNMLNIDDRVNDILEFFNLQEHSSKYPHQLSGGQQQLVAIARSLVMNPKILLMDEPLANLDIKLKRKILDYIKEIKSKYEVTIVYVTHDHKEAFSISDKIVVLNNGKIEDSGSVDYIKKSNNEYVQSFIEY
jgi:ABC-type Fe3+/spermidine/putrescine transport system ATPase subunit